MNESLKTEDEPVLLSMRHITKSFKKLVVLQDMSLEVHEHEIVVLCGPSGGGKSTLLRTINGLEKVDSGEIYYRGEKVTSRNIKEIRSHIGMVFQNFNLFNNLTIRDNLIIAPMKIQKQSKTEAIAKAQEYMDTFGIGDKMDRLSAPAFRRSETKSGDCTVDDDESGFNAF